MQNRRQQLISTVGIMEEYLAYTILNQTVISFDGMTDFIDREIEKLENKQS